MVAAAALGLWLEGPGVARSSAGVRASLLPSLPLEPLVETLEEPAKKGRPNDLPVGVGGGYMPEAAEFLREPAVGRDAAAPKASKGFLSLAEAFGVTLSPLYTRH